MTPLLPISYFGNLEYFYYFAKNNYIEVDVNELYQKQTFRNRAVVLGPNGLLNLSVPVERPFGKQTKTKDVKISYNENWQNVHWKTLESCYKRTPYFEFYADKINELLFIKHIYLVDLCSSLTNHLIKKIGIDSNLSITNSANVLDDILDLRGAFNSKQKKSFVNYSYLQPFIERFGHVQNLSILDLLFNEGPNSICILEESKLLK